MKKIILLIAIAITASLSVSAYLFADTLVSVSAFSIAPLALFFIIGVMGAGDVRFKDDEDDKLTKEECSLPIKTVAKIRHSRGLAVLVGCIPELFLVFLVSGFPKILFSINVFILFAAFSWKVYTFELSRALKENEK